jgi:hypothetical protein
MNHGKPILQSSYEIASKRFVNDTLIAWVDNSYLRVSQTVKNQMAVNNGLTPAPRETWQWNTSSLAS